MDQQATRTKPRFYTEDYKRQVVDLVVSTGRTPTSVASEVGLHPTLLCRWVRQPTHPAKMQATARHLAGLLKQDAVDIALLVPV